VVTPVLLARIEYLHAGRSHHHNAGQSSASGVTRVDALAVCTWVSALIRSHVQRHVRTPSQHLRPASVCERFLNAFAALQNFQHQYCGRNLPLKSATARTGTPLDLVLQTHGRVRVSRALSRAIAQQEHPLQLFNVRLTAPALAKGP
jgi:soluble lytic murein transglycosylase-like protein